jgi:hypothetical protein
MVLQKNKHFPNPDKGGPGKIGQPWFGDKKAALQEANAS